MTRISPKLFRYLSIVAALGLFVVATVPNGLEAQPESPEPVAYIGHGGFFDQNGHQIVPTVEFVGKAQDWYRRKLLDGLDPKSHGEYAAFEKRLNSAAARATGQARLVVQQHLLDWLVAYSPRIADDGRTLGKIRALKYELNWVLPERQELGNYATGREFKLDPELDRMLNRPEFNAPPGPQFLATMNTKAAYTAECAGADVPIPPPIGKLDPAGLTGWKTQGFIPINKQFITGTPAELRSFQDANGMCFALPRYTGAGMTTVKLDGVICLSNKPASRVCIWDNQMNGSGFFFPAGKKIPIGEPDFGINPDGEYQAGGFELNNGSGGVCTDCHAGENPYIIHPKANLGNGLLMEAMTVPTFAPNRYVPLVPASWPQNAWSQADPFVPTACKGCHSKGGAGRFPHLSTELNGMEGYCNTVLAQALVKTMPPGASAGTLASTPEVVAFKNWCTQPPTSGTADEGDPHLTTTNGVHYDFQAAGEFVSLRNSDTGFELQTRQTPVLTSFTPGANAYTGLASCVSLNTAAALRVGRHRISYQPSSRGPASPQDMQLRIDGRLVQLPAGGMNLGQGDAIARAASGGGLDIRLADGTRLLISPNYWASEGYWYLNVEVLGTRAREGTMGHIMPSNWLPLAPDGASFGPRPVSLADRHQLLNQKFADAWRVTAATSLFDYPRGLTTTSFTDRSWPPPSGAACRTSRTTPWGPGPAKPVEPMLPERARKLCRIVEDKAGYENCVFDMTAMGDPGVADAYRRVRALRRSDGPEGLVRPNFSPAFPVKPAPEPRRDRPPG